MNLYSDTSLTILAVYHREHSKSTSLIRGREFTKKSQKLTQREECNKIFLWPYFLQPNFWFSVSRKVLIMLQWPTLKTHSRGYLYAWDIIRSIELKFVRFVNVNFNVYLRFSLSLQMANTWAVFEWFILGIAGSFESLLSEIALDWNYKGLYIPRRCGLGYITTVKIPNKFAKVIIQKSCKFVQSIWYTAQKMKLFIKDFFSNCDQICRKLWIWSHLLIKS